MRLPARLHVLLARNSPNAVVFRRGPSKWVCTVGWDRSTDTFTLGQWLHGHIYGMRSDLSPDGRHLIYFAMSGHWDNEANGSWTAISRAPYLHALTLYAKGNGWHGGGLFLDDTSFWLNDGALPHTKVRDSGEVRRKQAPNYDEKSGGECPGVYLQRLERDGWQYRPKLTVVEEREAAYVYERSLPHDWTLRKIFRVNSRRRPEGKGVYSEDHELVGAGRTVARRDWEWAERDGKRLVWAMHGQLWAGRMSANTATAFDPVEDARMLYDFNDMTFEPVRAPYDRRG